jgi:type I restriction enzyme S subunit
LILNDLIDPYFIYSLTPILKVKAEEIASGSTFLEISGRMLSNIEIRIPNEQEQKTVGSLFRSIDTLITLHQREQSQELAKS